MNTNNEELTGGSLQISVDVLCKISKLAALEVAGVKQVSCGDLPVKGFFAKMDLRKPVEIELTDDVAEITVNVIVDYGCRIPSVSENVQESIKEAIQNMTGVTVSRVNVIVAGVSTPDESENI